MIAAVSASVPLFVSLIVVLPIVVLVAASIVVLFVAKNSVARAIAAVILLSFAILVVGGAILVPAFTVRQLRDEVDSTMPRATTSFEAVTWDASTEEALTASIYSSADSAARALAQSCLESFQAKLSEPPVQIDIVVQSSVPEYAPALATQLASFISQRFPVSKVTDSVAAAAPSPSNESWLIFVDLVNAGMSSGAPWDPSSRYTQGQIRLKGSYQGESYQDVRRFVEKPWVDHYDDFVSQRPGRRLMRANSTTFAVSEQESDRSAREQAAKLLAPHIKRSQGIPSGRPLDLAVQTALDSGEIIVDRFSQKLSSDSGDVWRTSLLIDARPQTLARLVQARVNGYEFRRRSAWIGVSLVFALTIVLYFVLDELTKGYFVWNLRVTALLTMLTLAVVFCWWINAMT